ncbi:MAG: V-type ATP synthase subunit D [Sulfolobales archaeon]|nr:V-type ATP synthase subunit D [Sulfolobales archaeon]
MAIDPRRVLPTKINLIKLRREERMLKRVRKLMEEKREVLLHYIKSYADEYSKYQKEVYGSLQDLFQRYYVGLAAEGIERAEGYVAGAEESLRVNVSQRVLFAVRVPSFSLDKSTLPPLFLPLDAHHSLSDSFLRLRELIPSLLRLAEYETTLNRLIEELKDTQRLINALDYAILPSYATAIRFVKGVLDQRMREDFIRLKMIKKKLEARAEVTAR